MLKSKQPKLNLNGKKYSIKLDGKLIGYTALEMNDAPMGAVMGKIHFQSIESGYDFFRTYCREHKILPLEDLPEDNFISIPTIEGLKVYNLSGTEIKGVGTNILGFEDDFVIDIFGIPYPFYGKEFPHHVKQSPI